MAIRPFHKVYPRASHYGHPAVSQGINRHIKMFVKGISFVEESSQI